MSNFTKKDGLAFRQYKQAVVIRLIIVAAVHIKRKDVEVKPPESVFLNEPMGMLFARATKSDQDKIEKLVEKIVLGKDVPVN